MLSDWEDASSFQNIQEQAPFFFSKINKYSITLHFFFYLTLTFNFKIFHKNYQCKACYSIETKQTNNLLKKKNKIHVKSLFNDKICHHLCGRPVLVYSIQDQKCHDLRIIIMNQYSI